MTGRPVVKVLYCGGCNPEIDRSQLVREVVLKLGNEASFASAKIPDVILLVNGCAHGCLDDEQTGSAECSKVSVQGSRIDSRPVSPEDLAAAVVARMREYLTRI